jgi:hypothetical protein
MKTGCTFMTISCGIPLRIRIFSDKICKENKHTFCIQYIFLSENRDVYEVMWKNMTHRWITTIYHISCCIQHSLMQYVALKMKPLPDK